MAVMMMTIPSFKCCRGKLSLRKVNWSTLGWSLAKKQPLSAEICRSNAEKGL